MRYKSLMLASILLAAVAYAKEPKAYQSGKLLQMDSMRCGVDDKDAKSFAGEIETDSGQPKTEEPVCRDYLLQADQVIYRIRPKNSRHPVLLPVGEWAQFRLEKDKMLLRAPLFDGKERKYTVISITPRGASTADAHPVRLNHLQ